MGACLGRIERDLCASAQGGGQQWVHALGALGGNLCVNVEEGELRDVDALDQAVSVHLIGLCMHASGGI